jgi:hypothetical protein
MDILIFINVIVYDLVVVVNGQGKAWSYSSRWISFYDLYMKSNIIIRFLSS